MQNSIMILGNTRNRYCLFYAKIWPFARVFDTKGMFDSKRISVKFYIYMHNEESSCTMASVCVCNIFNILKYIFYILYIFIHCYQFKKKRGRTTSATIGVCVVEFGLREKNSVSMKLELNQNSFSRIKPMAQNRRTKKKLNLLYISVFSSLQMHVLTSTYYIEPGEEVFLYFLNYVPSTYRFLIRLHRDDSYTCSSNFGGLYMGLKNAVLRIQHLATLCVYIGISIYKYQNYIGKRELFFETFELYFFFLAITFLFEYTFRYIQLVERRTVEG